MWTLTVSAKDKKKLDKLKTLNLKITKNTLSFRVRSRLKGIGWFTVKCNLDLARQFDQDYSVMNDMWTFISDTDKLYPHPHIEEDRPCLGSFVIPLADAVYCSRVYEVVFLCKKFLNEYDDAGAYVTYRDVVYCPDCGSLLKESDECKLCQ